MEYRDKYLKYKSKYLELSKMKGGGWLENFLSKFDIFYTQSKEIKKLKEEARRKNFIEPKIKQDIIDIKEVYIQKLTKLSNLLIEDNLQTGGIFFSKKKDIEKKDYVRKNSNLDKDIEDLEKDKENVLKEYNVKNKKIDILIDKIKNNNILGNYECIDDNTFNNIQNDLNIFKEITEKNKYIKNDINYIKNKIIIIKIISILKYIKEKFFLIKFNPDFLKPKYVLLPVIDGINNKKKFINLYSEINKYILALEEEEKHPIFIEKHRRYSSYDFK